MAAADSARWVGGVRSDDDGGRGWLLVSGGRRNVRVCVYRLNGTEDGGQDCGTDDAEKEGNSKQSIKHEYQRAVMWLSGSSRRRRGCVEQRESERGGKECQVVCM